MPLEATLPLSVVNVPLDYFSMAGFEVTLYGRFWVTPEVAMRPSPDFYLCGKIISTRFSE
jgi:hypothetical protein